MNAIDAIRAALSFGDNGLRLIETMSATPLTQPSEFGGNHAMWIAGHLAVTEGRLQKVLHGTPNPVEAWKPLFDWGSTPSADASVYPPLEEVVKTFRELRAKTIAYLDQIGDTGLDRPTASQPPGLEGAFDTVGKAVMTIACHQCFHIGQATVARRATGQSPAFEPSAALRAF